jgi:PST family polysaccharide transporter
MNKVIKEKYKSIISKDENRRLFSNIVSLGILQGLNYILPLITFPYQVRILGVEKFGLLAFASSVVAYFNILVDYGFNLTAPREIAIYRENKEKLSEIVSSIFQIKFVLFIIAAILFGILVTTIERFKKDALVYYITFGTILGQFLFPVWFFQGMERMKYITIFNVISRTFFTLLIFVFVKRPSDYFYVPLISSIGIIISGIASLYVIRQSFLIKLKLQKYSVLRYYIKESFSIFISNFAINIYTASTTLILGLFTNNVIVGYYAVADKIIQIFKQLLSPITQSLYPFITKKISENKENGLSVIKKVVKYLGTFTFLLSVFILIFSKYLVLIISGKNYMQSILPLRIMSFLPFIIALSNIMGIQTMLPLKMNKAFSSILITGSILNIVLSLIFVPVFQHIGSAITVSIIETFITVTMFVYLKNKGINIFEMKHK